MYSHKREGEVQFSDREKSLENPVTNQEDRRMKKKRMKGKELYRMRALNLFSPMSNQERLMGLHWFHLSNNLDKYSQQLSPWDIQVTPLIYPRMG